MRNHPLRFLVFLALTAVTHSELQAATTLQFPYTSTKVFEGMTAGWINIQRSGDTNTSVRVDYTTIDGTARNGTHYSKVEGTLAFEPGEVAQWIQVPLLSNGLVNGLATFRMVLTNPSTDATLGTRTNLTINVQDNDVGTQFKFETYSFAESEGQVFIDVVRGDDGNLPVSLLYTTGDRSAVSGIDYQGVTNTLTFEPHERSKTISISLLNNHLKQTDRTFQIALSNPTNANLGETKLATITVVDNDQGVQFERSSISVSEDAGFASLTLLRGSDETNTLVTVDLTTINGTAVSGVDFDGITNTVSFQPGETRKNVRIPISNDSIREGKKSFTARLSNVSIGAFLMAPTTQTVNIDDNDPGVGFVLAALSAPPRAQNVQLDVLRGSDLAQGTVSVHYATVDGTAKAGKNYEAVSGELVFLENETIKTISIPLIPTPSAASGLRFTVNLSSVTGNSVLGTTKTATITLTRGCTFTTVSPPFTETLNIQSDGEVLTLDWPMGAMLQTADSILGPWRTLTGTQSPATVQPWAKAAYYRLSSARTANVYVPSIYDETHALPLIVALHPYGGSGTGVEGYFNLPTLAETKGFLYCAPDSPNDRFGNSIWNSTDGIGNVDSTDADDVGFLRGLIEQISRQFAVDRKRIHLVGHSNGGFMAHRMACEASDLIAGIASVAGVGYLELAPCIPSEPVNILQIHGTADDTIPYGGGAIQQGVNLPAFPGAWKTTQNWAVYNQNHAPETEVAPSLDIDSSITGKETIVTRFPSTQPGGSVELWTIQGGGHGPSLNGQSTALIIDWLLTHPKP